VAANEVRRTALERSMVRMGGHCPYMPKSVMEAARRRCAEPHQATAWMAVFCTHANRRRRPSIAST